MPKDLPSHDLLHKLLHYEPETGLLFWRERTPDMFKDGYFSAAVNCRMWNGRFAEREAFTCKTIGYHQGCINYVSYQAHRIIWKMYYGDDPNFIDHIDHNRSNNKIINLRDCTHKENCRNLPISKANSSGCIGVSFVARTGRWRAYINFESRQIHLGYFDCKTAAVLSRASANDRYNFHPNHGDAL